MHANQTTFRSKNNETNGTKEIPALLKNCDLLPKDSNNPKNDNITQERVVTSATGAMQSRNTKTVAVVPAV